VINFWYGDTQTFGEKGNPQQWVNVLGRVTDDNDVTALTYSLNGNPAISIPSGPNGTRLVSTGDFNIEIDHADLIDIGTGPNTVEVVATDSLGSSATKTLTLNYHAGNVWPIPYTADWSTGITAAGDMVDGMWEQVAGGIHNTQEGYDRLIVLGDETWNTDYEVTLPLTIHSASSSSGVGFGVGWQGHTGPASPRTQWPLQAIGWIRNFPSNPELRILTYPGTVEASLARPDIAADTTYLLKMRSESIGGGNSTVSVKLWQQGTAEPAGWEISADVPTRNGSVLIITHHADVTYGNVDVSLLDTTGPTVTINQAGAQADPTASSPINFTVVFNESVSDFATGDVTLSGTAGATTGTVTGSGTTYNVAVSGMTSDGTVIANIAADVASDGFGNGNSASTSTDNTITYVVILVPTPITPNGTIYDRTPKYTWTKEIGATNYQFQLRKGTTIVYTTTVNSSICGTSTCSRAPSTILDYDDYKWRVRAKESGIWGAWSSYKTFTVKPVPVPTPIAPSGNITDTMPKYTWTKEVGATKYQIQLRVGTTLIYNKYAGSSACGSSTCSITPTTTLGYITYNWRVRANIGGVWGAWSSYKTFTVKPVPTPKTPSGDITDIAPKYTWTVVSGATKYQIQLRKGTTLVYNKYASSSACGTSTCSKTPATTLDYFNYKWRVRAKVGGVWGNWSSYKTFTVKPIPTPLEPSANITDRKPRYAWTVVSGAAKYQIQLRKGTTLVYNNYASSSVCGTSTCSKTPATTLGYFTYKWRVRAKIGGVWGPWSSYKFFTVIP